MNNNTNRNRNIPDFRQIRKKTFSDVHPYDFELAEMVKEYPSHAFLTNETSQNIYNYLTDYVIKLCQEYFDQDVSSLKILDWGCGKGEVSYLMAKKGATVSSCDINQERTDSSFGQEIPIILKSGIKVEPLNHPYILPYVDNQFDVVLSFGVLEHVPDDKNSMKEINRILKPEGIFFVFNLHYNLSWTQKLAHLRGDNYHDRLYTKKKIQFLSEACDFKIIDCWFRQFLPKNSINYPYFSFFESIDQFITEYTFLKYFATSLEFVAKKVS